MSGLGGRRGSTGSGVRPRPTRTRTVLLAKQARGELVGDEVVTESHLVIQAAGERLAVLACSAEHLDELALGHLWTQGVWRPADGRAQVTVGRDPGGEEVLLADVELPGPARERAARLADERGRPTYLPSGCGGLADPLATAGGGRPAADPAAGRGDDTDAGLGAGLTISPGAITDLARQLQHASPVFAATGGVHAAALAAPHESGWAISTVREDIGRHNAVDKVCGWCARGQVAIGDKLLLTTGRISGDIVAKAIGVGIPIILSRSAPTHLAVEAADLAGLTLIGFARGNRFTVYCNWWRVAGLPVGGSPGTP